MDKEYKNFIDSQLDLVYYKEIKKFIEKEISDNKIIYPSKQDVFNSFKKTPFDKMRVVIFGQDPYHNGKADGLAFSTNSGEIPKSLINIFRELKQEYKDISINSNNLTPWAKQGVLLLNSCLSVEKGKSNSHSKIGWDIFVRNFISYLNENKEFLIFVLWGNEAKKLKPLISSKFQILESSHPSPLSANKGFFGNLHFKQINKLLRDNQLDEIDWSL